MDIRQSSEYANYLSQIGWRVERKNGVNYFIKKLPLIGSVLKIQRPKTIDFREIERLRKKYRVFQIIIEPDLTAGTGSILHNSLYTHGFKSSKSPYLPTKTLQIDLTKPLKFAKETKRCIRIGERLKIKEYSTPREIETFRNAWKKSVPFNRYVPPLKNLISLCNSFPDNYSLFLASHNKFNKIIGGAVFTKNHEKDITFGKALSSAYYWYAFTSKEGRASLSQYYLLCRGILWAKKTGSKVFDFEGIYDPRFPNKSWLGFTHFKKSFGGYEVSYPGCYVKSRFSI